MKKQSSRIFRIGNMEEFMKTDTLRKAFTEFLCVLVFVFYAEGYVLFSTKIVTKFFPPPPTSQGLDNAQFLGIALTHGFGLMVAVAFGMNISGGLANPSVTFGAFLGGHITLFNTILYSIAQCLGGFAALGILKFASNGLTVYGWPGTTPLQGITYMIPTVFFLTYAYYVTIFDRKRGKKEAIAPMVIGFICICNIMVGGGFFGAAMNPAMALCIAAFSGMWNNHWSYWVGSYIGASLAALVYQTVNASDDDDDGVYQQQLPITTKLVFDEETYKQLLIDH